MALIKLEIDGKRIIADNRQTILQVARENGIHHIPTLCDDRQLEPFASCFLCVVKVKGARTLLPACSTKVAGGMIVETDNAEIRRSRKAALELMLSNHYADCIGPCQLQCPAGIDIQGYIALAALGKYRDAIQLIKERNPLPAVCGRVCTRPCEVRGCRRNMLDEAVGIDYIKRYIADLDLESREPFRPVIAGRHGRRVAVVGGGPAGLSAAYYLAIRGYDVQILEGLPEAGGMLRYGIPEYRLPKEVLDLEINQILDLGVRLRTNVALGRDFTIASLKQEGYEAIFLAIGAWDSSQMRVQEEDAPGVLSGIEFLKNFGLRKPVPLHGRVLVVGGGNTAIDCARTALRVGAGEVRLLYRRTRAEMPANGMEIDEAAHEGIEMDFLVAPVRVVSREGRVAGLECLRMELGEPDASGRRSPKPIRGSEFTIDCDWVIAAIGQSTKVKELIDGHVPNFLPMGEVLNLTRWQTIQVQEGTFETSVEGVFSGGDVVTGAATAIEAIAAGRKAAYAIDSYIQTGKAKPEPVPFHSRRDVYRQVTVDDLREGSREHRRPMPALPVEERTRGFVEVETGYTTDDLRQESYRCLECGCLSLFDCSLRKYATEYGVEIQNYLGEAKEYRVDRSHPLIELDPNKCILCGRCVRICSEVVGVSAFGFIHRGFSTVVRPELGGRLLDTECVTCGLCIGTCPTGAIVEKIPLAKPGPWETRSVPSICHYCGTGCRIQYDVFGDSLIKVSRQEDHPVTHGNHCRKGRFGYGHVQAADRLVKARIRTGRELEEVSVEDGIAYAGLRLKEFVRRFSGSEIAVFLSPRLTNEEAYLAQKFARVALRTHHVASLANLVNPELFAPDVVSTAGYPEVVDAQAILVVASALDSEHFVVDLFTKKAIRKGARMIYVGPEENRASAYAEVFLQCRPGTEARLMLALEKEFLAITGQEIEDDASLRDAVAATSAEDTEAMTGVPAARVREAAEILAKSILKVCIFNKDFRGPRTPGDARVIRDVARSLGCGLLAMHEKSNMQGILDMGAHPGWLPGYVPVGDAAGVEALEKEWCVRLQDLDPNGADIAALLREKKIRLAILLGEDPFGDESFPPDLRNGLMAADFLIVADVFETMTARLANIVLPLSTTAETSGSFTNQERRVQRVNRAVPPRSGIETWQMICRIAAEMGYRFKMKYANVSEVTEEIRRTVAIYRDVAIAGDPGDRSSSRTGGTADGDSIWDLDAFRLRGPDAAYDQLHEIVEPNETLFLDHVEMRFARWFDAIFEDARKRDEAQEVLQAAQGIQV